MKLTDALLTHTGIPRRYWPDRGITLEQIPNAASHKARILRIRDNFEEFVANGDGLYLFSETNGTGKTAIATHLAIHGMSFGVMPFYLRSSDLKDAAINQTLFTPEILVTSRARDVELLILDDFGKEYKTKSGFAETVVEDLIRARVQNMKSTIITSNLDSEKLEGQAGVGFRSLLRESFLLIKAADVVSGNRDWRFDAKQTMVNRYKA